MAMPLKTVGMGSVIVIMTFVWTMASFAGPLTPFPHLFSTSNGTPMAILVDDDEDNDSEKKGKGKKHKKKKHKKKKHRGEGKHDNGRHPEMKALKERQHSEMEELKERHKKERSVLKNRLKSEHKQDGDHHEDDEH